MEQTKSYVDILVNSLEKKARVLQQLEEIMIREDEVFGNTNIRAEEVSEIIDTRNEYLNKLEELDLGFEKLYERVKDEMASNKEIYKSEILRMQDLIRDISEKTVKLQAAQTRNKDRYTHLFSKKKHEIKEFKLSNKTVSNYYKNTYNAHQEGSSYFLDKKK